MKRLVLLLSVVIGAWMLSPTPEAEARGWRSNHRHHGHQSRTYRGTRSTRGTKAHRGVPELDPSAAGSAIVLLLGGVAYIASRRREEELA